jgi:hypothetical protein
LPLASGNNLAATGNQYMRGVVEKFSSEERNKWAAYL